MLGVLGVLSLVRGEHLEGRQQGAAEARRRLSGGDVTCEGDGAAETVGYIAIVLASFLGIAIVCDEFFQPALEHISEALKLSPDVAGATFLAAGSSAPELFTSIGDVFGPSNSIGLGTIVGSAMFNILVIVALSAAVAAGELAIDRRPVIRDVTFYTCSIGLLALFFRDSVINTHESAIMVAGYAVYIAFMVFNQRVFGLVCPAASARVQPGDDESESRAAEAAGDEVTAMSSQLSLDSVGLHSEHGSTRDLAAGTALNAWGDVEEHGEDRLQWPSKGSVGEKILFVASLPFLLAFMLTIPDTAQEKYKRWMWVAFLMSIAWIAALCYVMVGGASKIGCVLGASPITMGVVVLAVGTSVPDAIGSMIAAKNGEADMAIANAVGSNVFDILLGLGMPWLIYN
eukprot:g6232.t1